MKNVYVQIKRYGIFVNTLKIIAVISMFVDHVAFYFYWCLPSIVISVMRAFGRIAMPLFVYILVQGFFKTRNFKKYVMRVGICAVITQILIQGMAYINNRYFSEYVMVVYKSANILFSFVLTLLLLKVIHEPIILKKYTKEQNIIVKVVLAIALLSVYIVVNIDYGFVVPILATLLYMAEWFKITVLMAKGNFNVGIKGFALNIVDSATIEKVYKGLVILSLLLVIIFCGASIWTLLSLPAILLYNGEKRSQSKKTQMSYYVFFPLHHVVLYSLAMVLMVK